MPPTIQEIAELAGVSRGTVDRVIHGRGQVDKAVEKRILALMEQTGYRSNALSRNLAIRKQNLKLGMICRTDVKGFWEDLLSGTDAITAELADYNVTVLRRYFNLFMPEEQIALIDELESAGISGLVIVPLNDDRVRDKLCKLQQKGIAVLTITSELEDFEPFCYIGSDYDKAGRTAAGLLNLFAAGQHISLIILTGRQYMMSHMQRIDGFTDELIRLETPHTLIGRFDITSDPDFAYERTVELLNHYPETKAVYTVAGNVSVCKAIQDMGLAEKIIHISFDLTPWTRQKLIDGTLTACIGQEAYRQGYQPLKILFNYLAYGTQPEERHILTRNEIFIRQNCEGGETARWL